MVNINSVVNERQRAGSLFFPTPWTQVLPLDLSFYGVRLTDETSKKKQKKTPDPTEISTLNIIYILNIHLKLYNNTLFLMAS